MNKMTIDLEMKDGTEHCVSVQNPDQVRWDMYTNKHGYGISGRRPVPWADVLGLVCHGPHRQVLRPVRRIQSA